MDVYVSPDASAPNDTANGQVSLGDWWAVNDEHALPRKGSGRDTPKGPGLANSHYKQPAAPSVHYYPPQAGMVRATSSYSNLAAQSAQPLSPSWSPERSAAQAQRTELQSSSRPPGQAADDGFGGVVHDTESRWSPTKPVNWVVWGNDVQNGASRDRISPGSKSGTSPESAQQDWPADLHDNALFRRKSRDDFVLPEPEVFKVNAHRNSIKKARKGSNSSWELASE